MFLVSKNFLETFKLFCLSPLNQEVQLKISSNFLTQFKKGLLWADHKVDQILYIDYYFTRIKIRQAKIKFPKKWSFCNKTRKNLLNYFMHA